MARVANKLPARIKSTVCQTPWRPNATSSGMTLICPLLILFLGTRMWCIFLRLLECFNQSNEFRFKVIAFLLLAGRSGLSSRMNCVDIPPRPRSCREGKSAAPSTHMDARDILPHLTVELEKSDGCNFGDGNKNQFNLL